MDFHIYSFTVSPKTSREKLTYSLKAGSTVFQIVQYLMNWIHFWSKGKVLFASHIHYLDRHIFALTIWVLTALKINNPDFCSFFEVQTMKSSGKPDYLLYRLQCCWGLVWTSVVTSMALYQLCYSYNTKYTLVYRLFSLFPAAITYISRQIMDETSNGPYQTCYSSE